MVFQFVRTSVNTVSVHSTQHGMEIAGKSIALKSECTKKYDNKQFY